MKTLKSLFLAFGLMVAAVSAGSAQTAFNSINGTKVDLADSRGKVVILAVGASWLPLSAKQAEFTNILAKRYTGKEVVVYFVATDSTDPRSKNYATNDTILKFSTANKLTVPLLRDSDGATVLKLYEIDQLPSFVILDKQGRRSGEPFGGIDPKSDITIPISKAVDKLL
jgi:peroxiredoxin